MPASFELELPRDVIAARLAREAIGEKFPSLQGGELARATLLVSELASNALLHGEGTITLRAELDEERLLIEVIDDGCGFEATVRASDVATVGGWGLAIVNGEATRWGVYEGTTHVWVELRRPEALRTTSGEPEVMMLPARDRPSRVDSRGRYDPWSGN